MSRSQKYFDPETLARIRPLGLRAQTLVEGLVAGLHRSPLRGHSIEFAQHREYAPGDDLRQVDWKVYARSDRYYLKQYEDETNLNCYLLLDQSESMLYQGQNSPLSKLEYAQLVVCSLAYLVISQQDSAGLISFSESIDHWLESSSSQSQLDDMIQVLESGNHAKRTGLASVLQETTRRLNRPALIILLSDLFIEDDELFQALKLVRHAGHDILVMHILDQDETHFPFDETTQFNGLENWDPIIANPVMIAGAYRKAMAQLQQRLKTGCQQLGVDYFLLQTDESLALSLPAILAQRQARRQ